MKNYISSLLLLAFLSPAIAANEYVLEICDNCSSYEMQNQAFQHRALNKTVEVQVVNPENGNVSAFRVK